MSDETNTENNIHDKVESFEQVGDLIDTYTAIEVQPEEHRGVVRINEDLKDSLTTFVQNFLRRVQGHKELEDILKEALIEKLPEADFEQIEKLLNTVMRNSNNAVEKILAPFSQKENIGDTHNTFLLGDKASTLPIEEKILKDEKMTPEIMKGLYDLAQMMNAITSSKQDKK